MITHIRCPSVHRAGGSLKDRLKVVSPATLIATAALVIAVAGQPIAEAARHVVASIDGHQIKRQSIPGNRIKQGTLDGVSIAKRSISGSRLQLRTIRGSNIAPNSLNATQIDEGAIGKVPSAFESDDALTVGGIPSTALTVGRSGSDDECNPTSSIATTCAIGVLNISRSGRVLVVASADWHADSAPARGRCSLWADGTELPGSVSEPGVNGGGTDATHNRQLSLTTVSAAIVPGVHEFSLACSENQGDLHLINTAVSAVLLGVD